MAVAVAVAVAVALTHAQTECPPNKGQLTALLAKSRYTGPAGEAKITATDKFAWQDLVSSVCRCSGLAARRARAHMLRPARQQGSVACSIAMPPGLLVDRPRGARFACVLQVPVRSCLWPV